MSQSAIRRATYEDVLNAAAHQVAELIDGELLVHPRPAARHARSASALGEQLDRPFDRGVGGPGDWIILDEPELHLFARHSCWRRASTVEPFDAIELR